MIILAFFWLHWMGTVKTDRKVEGKKRVTKGRRLNPDPPPAHPTANKTTACSVECLNFLNVWNEIQNSSGFCYRYPVWPVLHWRCFDIKIQNWSSVQTIVILSSHPLSVYIKSAVRDLVWYLTRISPCTNINSSIRHRGDQTFAVAELKLWNRQIFLKLI